MRNIGKVAGMLILLSFAAGGLHAESDKQAVDWSGQISVDLIRHAGPEPLERPVVPETIESIQAPLLNPVQLDSAILENMDTFHIPGLSACVIVGDDIVWTGSYGYKDDGLTEPVGDTTLFRLASISKTFVATAILQLWEDGLVDIDADVNDYLPFTVENPWNPGSVITLRMLMAHVSSIDRRDWTWYPSDLVCGQDHPTPLEQYLEDYLDPTGSGYSPDNYLSSFPGTFGQYSNYGFAVLGAVVEHVTGMTLEDYCQTAIFGVLGMNETSWRFANLDSNNIANPMGWVGSAYAEWCHAGSPLYPAGNVRSSCIQVARHLSAFLGYGEVDGIRILDSATVEEIMTIQYPGTHPLAPTADHGLGWYRGEESAGYFWGHGGNFRGIQTSMFGRPADNTGVVLLCNMDYNSGYQAILNLIWEFSRDADLDAVIAGMDNCGTVANPSQADFDGDAAGDACDLCPRYATPGDVGVMTGDANLDGNLTSADIIYLVNYVFKGGPQPLPITEAGDVNFDQVVTSADVIYMVNHVFKGGEAPLDACAV